ncbi:MAG: hypothetical protein ACT4OF_00190 [Caulobacteraceae bacterium]
MLPAEGLDQVAGRLGAMTRDGGSIDAAQVKLIGLDEIREAAGPRWPRMRERVRSGSMSILSQHIGPDDVILPAGDGFLIMLADTRAGDTQRRCQEMRDALLKFYLGEDALASLRPEVQNRALTVQGLTDLISTSVRDNRIPVVEPHDEEIAIAPVLATQEHKVVAALAAPVTRSARVRRIAHNPDFILDGRHHGGRYDYLELDIAVLDAALSYSNRLRIAGHPAIVGVSVHATTMQTRKYRETYLSWVRGIEADLRRTLFISINEVERGTPLMSIGEWCAALRAHISRISVNLHYTDHAIGSLGGAGVWAAGFHLPTTAGVQCGDRSQWLRRQIGHWARSMHNQGMRFVVHGFQDAAFLEQARSMGVDMLTSDAHWHFESAGGVVRL